MKISNSYIIACTLITVVIDFEDETNDKLDQNWKTTLTDKIEIMYKIYIYELTIWLKSE